MQKALGVLLILCGIAGFIGSIYLGIVVMLVGGMVDTVHAIRETNLNEVRLVWDIVCILLFLPVMRIGCGLSIVLGSCGGFFVADDV